MHPEQSYFGKRIVSILVFISIFTGLNGMVDQQNKYEFRAVWVATVANIDWPSRPGLPVTVQKQEIQEILDMHKRNGMNAIILQVRPCGDAFYASSLEPWSVYLNGVQGEAPDPFYDPLEYWINETHRRGMELHAWFNPYRVRQHPSDSLASGHILTKHPEWCFTYGSKTYLAPGHPEVWEYVTGVVTDVVNRYDIDAVHLDDYFYPYRIGDAPIPDDSTFRAFGGSFYPDRKEAWRRHNVDTIIQVLGKAVKQTKPWVKFGISPFGVWKNRAADNRGSETSAGTTNYDILYADVLKWQRLGWIDYLMPQVYWRDDHPAADFSTLAYWWNDFHFGRAMYVGLAPYRLRRDSEYRQWKRDRFLLRQVELVQSLEGLDGYGFFSSRHFGRKKLRSLSRKLRRSHNRYPAIVPPMPWIDAVAPNPPEGLEAMDHALHWETEQEAGVMEKARFYVIYRYRRNSERTLKRAENIIAITGEPRLVFEKKIPRGIYRVAALDRLNNESQLSDPITIQ